jgi:hypothetical protein
MSGARLAVRRPSPRGAGREPEPRELGDDLERTLHLHVGRSGRASSPTPSAFRLSWRRARQDFNWVGVLATTRNPRRMWSGPPGLGSKTAGSSGRASRWMSGVARGSASRAIAARSRAASRTSSSIGARERLSIPHTNRSRTSPPPCAGGGSSSPSKRTRRDLTWRRSSVAADAGGSSVCRRNMCARGCTGRAGDALSLHLAGGPAGVAAHCRKKATVSRRPAGQRPGAVRVSGNALEAARRELRQRAFHAVAPRPSRRSAVARLVKHHRRR